MSKKSKYCCPGMDSFVEKGWIEFRRTRMTPIGRKYFIVVIAKKNEYGDNIGLILEHCFICGENVYPITGEEKASEIMLETVKLGKVNMTKLVETIRGYLGQLYDN